MKTIYVFAVILAGGFGVHGGMMILAVPSMRAGAARVGFTVTQYRGIGALEVAAALGVIGGLVAPMLGIAAGAGLVALMIAAVIVHARSGDPIRRMLPAIVLGSSALGYVALLVAQLG